MSYKLRFPFSGPWQEFNNWVERATWILPHPQSAHQKCSNLVQRKVHLSKRIRNIQKRDKKMLLKVKTSKTWGEKYNQYFLLLWLPRLRIYICFMIYGAILSSKWKEFQIAYYLIFELKLKHWGLHPKILLGSQDMEDLREPFYQRPQPRFAWTIWKM